MFLLWLIIGLIPLTSAETQRLSCNDKAADVLCLIGKTCSVSCDENCSLFGSLDDVSICGWLQSSGYDTSELLATPKKYNVEIGAVNNQKSDTNKLSKRKRSTVQTKDHVYPYIQFYFIRQPDSQMKQLGLPVVFYCNASGNSSLKYQWYKSPADKFAGTITPPNPIPGETEKQYSIPSTQAVDNGYYICVVTESSSGDVYWSEPAKLEVLYLEKPNVITDSTTVDSGEVIKRINCELPPSYPAAVATWYRYNAGVAEKIEDEEDTFFNPKSGILYLLNTNSASHNGDYECQAENVYLSDTTVVKKVTVTISGSTQPDYKAADEAFFDKDAARTATIGSKLILRCAAYGNPIPTVYWTFGDGVDTLCRIPSSRYKSYDNGRKVELYEVKQQDTEYIYECIAETDDKTEKIDTLQDVGVYKTLEIIQDQDKYTPRYGSTFTLACPVTALSLDVWYKNGVMLSENSGEYWRKVKEPNSLVITASTQSHGVYTCLSLSPYGGLVLKNLHATLPVLPVTIHLYLDMTSNEIEDANTTFLTCAASGYPPPRLYWFENDVPVTDSSRYKFSFDIANSTIINTTLNISNLRETTEIKCLAVSQTEHYVSQDAAFYTVNPEGENIEKVENKNMYIIIGASCILVVFLIAATVFLGWRFKRERKNTKPIRSYIEKVQQIQRDSGGDVSSKAKMREEYKYAAHLHDILKTMQIKDEGDIESFRDVIEDWVNEELPGGEDSDFARRFRESFVSKRSIGTKFSNQSSNRYGNQFKLDLKSNEKKVAESNMLDETPERNALIPLGKRSPRRASNPIYAPIDLPENRETDGASTERQVLRNTAL